jgi:hypothetical protein
MRGPGFAFVHDPREIHARLRDDLAETLAESYVASAISGEEHTERELDAAAIEELGGPFVPDDAMNDLQPAPRRRASRPRRPR